MSRWAGLSGRRRGGVRGKMPARCQATDRVPMAKEPERLAAPLDTGQGHY